MLSPEYAAGFFDGEGTARFASGSGRAKNHARIHVSVANTFEPILWAFKETFGGYIRAHRAKNRNPRHKQAWIWYAVSGDAIAFLQAIQPFVIVKKAQVELALDFAAFRATPKPVRCEYIRDPQAPTGGRGWRRTEETLLKEAEYQARMLGLNRKGTQAFKEDS